MGGPLSLLPRSAATASMAAPSPLNMLTWALLLQGLQWAAADSVHAEASSLYDWGFYGAFPRMTYESFGAQSPWPNVMRQDARCYDGYTFIEPRGIYVETPGPIILDNEGNLVWMQTEWGQAMDLKVQHFQGQDYITFWHGSDNGTFGEGYYLMINETYDVFKKVTPVGDLTGDLHEFRITDEGTALMTIYQKIPTDMSAMGIPNGWIFDSVFQEIDLATNELIFEWRASEHYDVEETFAPLSGLGTSSGSAFDFFHINSVDKNADGDYLISSRYMCAVAQISHEDGRVMWQLGGEGNSFEDLSQGAATNFSWNHHASWYENTTLTVFDNGSNGHQNTAKHSRGLMIELDLEKKTAALVRDFTPPSGTLSPSQGSVQVLPNSNVLVGWGHTPAFTEYTMDGQVLCDTHLAPIRFSPFGWVKNYRTFKYSWVGRPRAPPDVAMRPGQKALYASWNGATEVASWKLQSGPEADGDDFADHRTVEKRTFETRMSVPDKAGPYVRAVALDVEGNVLGTSRAVSRHDKTVVSLLEAPSRGRLLEPYTILSLCVFGGIMGVAISYYFRSAIRRGYHRVLRRGATSFQYQSLPTHGA